YGNLMYPIWKKKNKSTHHVWHFDETYIKVKGEWRYLYRAINGDGYTLLRKTRDHKDPTLLCAFKKIQKYGYYIHIKHCTIKHRNNLIEQDHRHIKRRFSQSAGFQSLRHASRTLKGIKSNQYMLYIKENAVCKQTVFF
ncbi:hypothetical protein IKE_05763, partial [Bacillus cereus VD196]